MNMQTWFNYQIADSAPEKASIDLPSVFQIGDEIDLCVENLPVIEAVVYAVKFAGNGTVNYDLAIPIAGTTSYSIVNDIRGCMRPRGSNEAPTELLDVETLKVLTKRAMFHVVPNSLGDQEEIEQ